MFGDVDEAMGSCKHLAWAQLASAMTIKLTSGILHLPG